MNSHFNLFRTVYTYDRIDGVSSVSYKDMLFFKGHRRNISKGLSSDRSLLVTMISSQNEQGHQVELP